MDPDQDSSNDVRLRAHAAFLQRLARRLVSDEHDAQDAAQEAALAYLERPPRTGASVAGWFARVVGRRASNARRADQRRARRERHAARSEATSQTDPAAAGLAAQREVVSAVEALAEPYRSTIWLRFYEDLAPRRIAERTGVPVETVKTRLRRGLALLRADLDGRFEGDRGAWCVVLAPLALARRGSLASGVATLGGIVVMNKLVVAVGTALVALAAWSLWQGGELTAPTQTARPNRSPAELAGEAALDSPVAQLRVADDSAGERAPVAASTSGGPGEPYGSLGIQAQWADGTPAAGLLLVVYPADDPSPSNNRVREVTDANGRMHLARVHAGRVYAVLPRGASEYVDLEPGEHGELVVRLAEGIQVSGRVEDKDGGPIAGAHVWLGGGSYGWDAIATDEAGRYHLRDVAPACFLGARAAGFAPSSMVYLRSLGAQTVPTLEVRLVLGVRGGAVAGVVRGPNGEALAGAQLKIGPPRATRVPGGEAIPPQLVESDASGAFVARGLAPGPQPVAVRAAGLPLYRGSVEVVAGETAWLDLQLVRPVTVVGRVTAAGEPVAGANVVANRGGRMEMYRSVFSVPEIKSDPDGRFRLALVTPGSIDLHVKAPHGSHLGESAVTLVGAAGETLIWDARLDPGLTIAGHVVDESGEPLVGWPVDCTPERRVGVERIFATTDSEGRFVFTNCLEYAHGVNVRRPGESSAFPVAIATGVVPGGDELELVAQVAAGTAGRLVGRLVDAAGRPVTTGMLLATRELDDNLSFTHADASTGEFAFERVPAGGIRVRVLDAAGKPLLHSEQFAVVAGETLDLGTLVVHAPGSVRVNVRADARLELKKVHGFLSPAVGGGTSGLTRTGTVFRIVGQVPGDYHLRFWNGGAPERRIPVVIRAGEETVLEVELGLGVPVQLVVEAARTESPGSARITVRDAVGAWVLGPEPMKRDEAGVLRFTTSLVPGSYSFEATGLAGAPVVVQRALDFGMGDPVVLRLP